MSVKKQAMFYEKLDNGSVHCYLCPHNCIIKDEHFGFCKVRKNEGGMLFSQNYGKAAAIAMDPVEKKPLFHFYPGKYLLSIGSAGCNMACLFCQNYHISKEKCETRDVTSEDIVKLCAKKNDCIGIAYTYNEPSIWYEFVYETSRLAREEGYKNVLVTNGFISKEPLEMLLPYIDAMNIDVKGFSEDYYKKICSGGLEEVKRTVEISALSCHIEITTLVVPELNDSDSEIEEMCKWIAGIDRNIPLHLSRYFPKYKMNKPPTPIETLLRLKEIGEKYLNYVYLGNV